MASAIKIEFAVQMKSSCCVEAVQKVLESTEGVLSVKIDGSNEQVVVETTLPSRQVKDLIESTGRRAVLQGLGSAQGSSALGAAVCMVEGGGVRGITRLTQVTNNSCVLDGTIDGLAPGQYGLFVHELGDISQGCTSCGNVFDVDGNSEQKTGDLGLIVSDDGGRAEFRTETSKLKVWDIIGRSMVIHNLIEQSSEGQRIACGIVARSSGLFENPKRICACDGVTLWDERDVPIAGSGRKAVNQTAPAAQL